MTIISFQCPKCRVTHKTKVENAGKRSRCPKCGNPLVVPNPPSTPDTELEDDGTPHGTVTAPQVQEGLGPRSAAKVTKAAAQRKTVFREHSLRWQQSQRRTRNDDIQGIVKASYLTLGGLACLLLGVIGVPVSLLMGTQSGKLGFMGLVGSATLLVGGIALGGTGLYRSVVGLGRVLLASRRVVSCPGCGAQHEVYTSAKSFLCPGCYELLLLGSDIRLQPQVVPCPYCGRKTLLCSDHGDFRCPNCGLFRHANHGGVEGQTQPCPQCTHPIPDSVFFCNDCRLIVRTDFGSLYYPWLDSIDQKLEEDHHASSGAKQAGYDFEWEIGKDGTGHILFARALLKATKKDAGRPGSASNARITQFRRNLTKALMSMEEAALYDSPCLQEVLTLVPEMDVAYAALLDVECCAVEVVKRDAEAAAKDGAYAGALLNRTRRWTAVDTNDANAREANAEWELGRVLEDEVHILARKQLEKTLGDSLECLGGGRYGVRAQPTTRVDGAGGPSSEIVDKFLKSVGGVGMWSEHLVSTERDGEGHFLINWQKLKAERDRFRLKGARP